MREDIFFRTRFFQHRNAGSIFVNVGEQQRGMPVKAAVIKIGVVANEPAHRLVVALVGHGDERGVLFPVFKVDIDTRIGEGFSPERAMFQRFKKQWRRTLK